MSVGVPRGNPWERTLPPCGLCRIAVLEVAGRRFRAIRFAIDLGL